MLLSIGFLEKWNIEMLAFVHYSNISALHYSQFAFKNNLLHNFGNSDGTQDIINYNAARMKSSHSLDIRVDKRWYFSGWTLITYLDIQNIYNQKNASGIRWDKREMKVDESSSIGILPSIGISAEF